MLFTRSSSRLLIGLLAAAVVLTGLLASPAHARAGKMSMAGIGTAVVPTDGEAPFNGTLSGSPLSGAFTGTLTPADGTLPVRVHRVVGPMQVRLLGDQSDVYAVGAE